MISKPPNFKQRYWYCEISQYYPCGFLDDVDASCDTLEELKSLKAKDVCYGWEVFYDAEKRELLEI